MEKAGAEDPEIAAGKGTGTCVSMSSTSDPAAGVAPISPSSPTLFTVAQEGAGLSKNERAGHGTCVRPFAFMRKYPTILLVSLLIFVTLAVVGVVCCHLSFESLEDEADKQALEEAKVSGDKLSSALDMAIVPLFSMAQFATELSDFKNLPQEIGEPNEPLPFLLNSDGSPSAFRNMTGVCDQPDLIQRYAEIVSTIKKNLKMEGILQNLQLLPQGVLCISHGSIDMSKTVGFDILHDPTYGKGARASISQEKITLAGPLKLETSCPECGYFFVARFPVLSETHEIVVNGNAVKRWGVVSALYNWEELLKQSNINDIKARGYEFQLTRVDGEGDTIVLAESEGFGSKEKEVLHGLKINEEEWGVTVQYNPGYHTRKAALIAISIVGPFLLACLILTVLVQKQIHTAMLGEALAQKAKVNVERNIVAYFAHGTFISFHAVLLVIEVSLTFIASTELRNPLQAISCALESMPDNLPADAHELVSGMQLCSDFMSSIMNNLLDVRKIEEGKMVLHSDSLSLASLLQDVCKMTLPSVRSGVELKVLTETKGQDCVYGDIHRLQQVLTNLVTNAIKYTTSGSITLYAGWEGDNVRLECIDTGPGIPKEEQTALFERFVMRGGAPGSGLGLASKFIANTTMHLPCQCLLFSLIFSCLLVVAKQVVDFMGGSIHFESDPTVKPGTSCIVLLPLVPTLEALPSEPTAAKQEEDGPIDEPFSILIIDDINMNRVMLKKRILKSIAPNSTVSEASTGEEAITRCESESFDVLIVDQYMESAGGVLLGTDVIEAMRRSGITSFIIGCSGNDLDSKFISAGADLVWGKPCPCNKEIKEQFRFALEKQNNT